MFVKVFFIIFFTFFFDLFFSLFFFRRRERKEEEGGSIFAIFQHRKLGMKYSPIRAGPPGNGLFRRGRQTRSASAVLLRVIYFVFFFFCVCFFVRKFFKNLFET